MTFVHCTLLPDTLPDSEMSDDCVWPPLSDGASRGRPGHRVSASTSCEPASAADKPSSSLVT